MDARRKAVVMAMGIAMCFCGCTTYNKSLMEEAMRKQAEFVAAAKANPLPPLPDYPEDANAVYDTSVSLMIAGNTDLRDEFSAELQKAGYRVLGEQDKQMAAFQLPDVILYPKCQHSHVLYGDGASWRQIELIVWMRNAIRLAEGGTVERMPCPRIFKIHARVKNSDDSAVFDVPDSPAAYDIYISKKQAKEKEEEREALKVAISRLMHIDAFRRAISTKRIPE